VRFVVCVLLHGAYFEVAIQLVVERENRRDVATAIAVVGRRPNSDEILVGKHVFVALLHQLMRAADELESVDLNELVGNLPAKQPAGAARRHLPRLNLLRIGPHQVAERALVRNLLVATNGSNLIQRSHIYIDTYMILFNCKFYTKNK
jgi:hypothetical protein